MGNKFNILLATDYSDAIMNAERYAFQFAKYTKSHLRIIHVFKFKPLLGIIEESDYGAGEYYPLEEEINKLEQHVLLILASLQINTYDVKYECVVREGNIREEIMSEAVESGSDLIIAGTHGVGLLQKIMLGTHTWDIIKNSAVPVLAIPEDALFTGIRHVAYVAEFREEEINAIYFLNEFANAMQAQLTVLHITNYSKSREFEKFMFDKFRKELNNKIKQPPVKIFMLRHEDKVTGLNIFCMINKISWLAMSNGKSNWVEKIIYPDGSGIRKMTFNTHVPLFIIPDIYDPIANPDLLLKTI
ncbi:MAG: universal stress protein [Bacteroidota bacterium]|nr:universal stress protein [Bacteroidota bacterium]